MILKLIKKYLVFILFMIYPASLFGQEVPHSLLYDMTWGLYSTALDTSFDITAPENNSSKGAYLFGGLGFTSEGISTDDIEPFEIAFSDSLAKNPWALYIKGEITNYGEQENNYTNYLETGVQTVEISSAGSNDTYTWYDERQKYVYTGARPEIMDWTAAFLVSPVEKNNFRTGFLGHYLMSYGNSEQVDTHYSSNYNCYTSYFYNSAADGEKPEILPVYHTIQNYEQPLYKHDIQLSIPFSWSVDTRKNNFELQLGLLLDDRDYTYTKSWIPVNIQESISFTAREETIDDLITSYFAGLSYNLNKELKREGTLTSFLNIAFTGIFNHFLPRDKSLNIITQDYSGQPGDDGQEIWASFRYENIQSQDGIHQFGGEGDVSLSLPFYLSYTDRIQVSFAPGINISGETEPVDSELITKITRIIREDYTGDADFNDEADLITTYITTRSRGSNDLDASLTCLFDLPLALTVAVFNPFEFIFSLKCWSEYSLESISCSAVTEETSTLIQNGSGEEVQALTGSSQTLSAAETTFSDNWSFGCDYRLGCRLNLKNGNSLDLQLNTTDVLQFESLSFSATFLLF